MRKVPHNFEVHSNESACRKKIRLGLEQVDYEPTIPFTFGGKETVASAVGYTKLVFAVFAWGCLLVLVYWCHYQLLGQQNISWEEKINGECVNPQKENRRRKGIWKFSPLNFFTGGRSDSGFREDGGDGAHRNGGWNGYVRIK